MLILDATTKRLRLALGTAQTTTPMRIVSSWRDTTSTTFTPGSTLANSNGTTPVEIVPAPAASTQRVVDFVSIYNSDSVTKVVTLSLYDGTTDFIITSLSLGVGERIEYSEANGVAVYNSAGALKTIITGTNNLVSSGFSTVILGADITNNNGVANTIADITGLSFPVVSINRYYFKFIIHYTAAATTTGARFAVNGPAFTLLTYQTSWGLLAATGTDQISTAVLNAYDQPAASNATSPTTAGNLAVIEGFITPSADGNVIARFASEVASSAIVAKQGSLVQYAQV